MTSINKKKIALIEKYNQEKLRNKAMKMGVTLKSPETVFLCQIIFFLHIQIFSLHDYAQSSNRELCRSKFRLNQIKL